MDLVISYYAPPKSASYGHTPRLKDIEALVERVEAVQKLIVPEASYGSLWIIPTTDELGTFRFWRHRLSAVFPHLSIPESVAELGSGIQIEPTEFSKNIRLLGKLSPLPAPEQLHLTISLCVGFTWRGDRGDRHDGYQSLPGGLVRDHWSSIHFTLGNQPHVRTQFVYPVRHDGEEGRRLTASFNDAGLVQLNEKYFKLMRYNPKSKKWSPTRTT